MARHRVPAASPGQQGGIERQRVFHPLDIKNRQVSRSMLRSLEFALMLAMYGANDTRTHGSVKGIDFPCTPAQKVISDAPMYCARTLDLDQSFGQQQEKAFGLA